MGAPRTEIDLAELEKLCAMQCTDVEIAAWFGVSTRTIERRRKVEGFNEVMEQGKAKGRISLRRSLWRLANEGNAAANIFLAKNLLGYRDSIFNEHSGPAGGPLRVSVGPDLSRLDAADLMQIRTLMAKSLCACEGEPQCGNSAPSGLLGERESRDLLGSDTI